MSGPYVTDSIEVLINLEGIRSVVYWKDSNQWLMQIAYYDGNEERIIYHNAEKGSDMFKRIVEVIGRQTDLYIV
jgi:hypothetical protein